MAAGGRNPTLVTRFLSMATQQVAGSTLVDKAEGLLLAVDSTGRCNRLAKSFSECWAALRAQMTVNATLLIIQPLAKYLNAQQNLGVIWPPTMSVTSIMPILRTGWLADVRKLLILR